MVRPDPEIECFCLLKLSQKPEKEGEIQYLISIYSVYVCFKDYIVKDA